MPSDSGCSTGSMIGSKTISEHKSVDRVKTP